MKSTHRIKVGNQAIDFLFVRSKRKTIGITVSKEGWVKVTAPLKAPEDQVIAIVQSKASWIAKKLDEVKSKSEGTPQKKRWTQGEQIMYLGKPYELILQKKAGQLKGDVRLQDNCLVVDVPDGLSVQQEMDFIKIKIKKWFLVQFADIIKVSMEKFSSVLHVFPSKVTVRDQKTRWGSCSRKGSINLNWRLVMAPMDVVDYVFVHELCHMKEMNHSERFWRNVENILPDFKESRKWLKENGHLLSFE